MAQAAKVREAPPPAVIRRFDLGDFTYHGPWLFPRIIRVFPHVGEGQIAGWLRGLIENSHVLFLRSDNAVALFEMVSEQLVPAPTIRERFVLCRDEKHVLEASWFYQDALRWGRACGATAIEVETYTDVPHDMIRDRLGLRLFNVERVVARL